MHEDRCPAAMCYQRPAPPCPSKQGADRARATGSAALRGQHVPQQNATQVQKHHYQKANLPQHEQKAWCRQGQHRVVAADTAHARQRSGRVGAGQAGWAWGTPPPVLLPTLLKGCRSTPTPTTPLQHPPRQAQHRIAQAVTNPTNSETLATQTNPVLTGHTAAVGTRNRLHPRVHLPHPVNRQLLCVLYHVVSGGSALYVWCVNQQVQGHPGHVTQHTPLAALGTMSGTL